MRRGQATDILGRKIPAERLEPSMFEESDTAATDEQLAEWKAKLVLANVHQRRMEELKKFIGGEMAARVKHYKKLSAALADAVRFKSTTELERAFREWERILDELKPLDKWHDSLKHWADSQTEDQE